MVDRPIKKSDRDAAKAADPDRKVAPPIKKADRKDGGPSSEKSGDSRDSRDGRGRGKGKGKGRGRGKDDAPKAPVNPALMRGPKPTQKVEEPEVVEAPAVEGDAPVAADVAATPEAPSDTAEAMADDAAPEAPVENAEPPAAEAKADEAAAEA
ncbi:MAG: hypothetical protein AAGM27_07175 [Cyanobacteria bacterium J06554_3]